MTMTKFLLNLNYLEQQTKELLEPKPHGELQEVTGLILKCKGPWGNIGDLCSIVNSDQSLIYGEISWL